MAQVFITQKIIEPIFEFIKTCPFLDEFHIDMTPSSTQRLSSVIPEASALDYVGSNMISDVKDLLVRRYTRRQANFQLWLLRKSNHDIYREETANFIYNFEQWIEFCQYYNLTPKLSDTFEGKVEEIMFADNGAYFSEWEEKQSSVYLINLHIIYSKTYK